MNFEFRKGLLFIRLSGILNRESSKEFSKCLDRFINEQGVKYFVINLENLDSIDKDGINIIKEKYEDMVLHDGKLIICGYKNDSVKRLVDTSMKGVYQTNNELMAFNIIRV